MRVTILYNDDEGLAHGEAQDRLAAQGVLDEVRALRAAIEHGGHEVTPVQATADARRMLDALAEARPDVVFNAAEALAGEARLEAAVAWLLELSRVPYTGSPPVVLSIALEKPVTRAILSSYGIPVAPGTVLERGDEPFPKGMRPPFIVKPSREDASHGISESSVTSDEAAARARARYVIERYRQPALVEQFIDGRELNVSIIGSGDRAEVLPIGEIDFSKFPPGRPKLVTYEAKWVEASPDYKGTPSVAARELDKVVEAQVCEVALAAYRRIGVRDYGRVDLRLDPLTGPVVLEVNPNPDISPDAGLARAAARRGLSYEQLIARIVSDARDRAPEAARSH